MSKPHYEPAAWRPDRLRLACLICGIGSPSGLRHLINEHRGAQHIEPVRPRTVERWWSGEVDPSMGRTGHPSAVFELAHVLQVSVDWLTGRVKREPSFTAHARSKFAGHEGWS